MNKSLATNFISIFLLLLLFSCGDKSKQTAKSEASIALAEEQSEFKNERTRALSVLKFRKESSQNVSSSINGYHEYQAIYDGGMSEKGALAGEWLKFNDDFTYAYGKYNEEYGTGKYHHSFDSSLLLMIDDDANKIPKEYKTQHGNTSLLLVGQNTYGANAVQQFLNKVEKRPAKQE